MSSFGEGFGQAIGMMFAFLLVLILIFCLIYFGLKSGYVQEKAGDSIKNMLGL